MAENRGIAPLEPTTDVGQFRLLSGDSSYVEYDPPEIGYGLYANWSDDEINAFLAATNGSIPRAIALAYTQMAAHWVAMGSSIRTDDLTYSSKESVGSWLNLADYWNKVADDQENASAIDYFDLVTVRGDHGFRKPEAAPWPVGGGGQFW